MSRNGKIWGQNGVLWAERYVDMPWGRIVAFWDEKRAKWRLLKKSKWSNGVETFYNQANEMIEFDTEDQAWEWYDRQQI